MKKAVTLKDIARETGVHVSTVSRALDPSARTSLTEEVVQRVREAAKRMGYRPNRLASGLRTSRTMTVGMMIPDITNTLFPPIVRGVESVLEPLGYASIIVNTDSDSEREDRLLDVLRERGVDGIVHAAVTLSDPRITEAAAQGLPVVTVNRRIDDPSIPAVINDDAGGIRMAMRHLHAHGHRNIAHIAGPAELSTGRVRRQAFVEAARELGLEIPERALRPTSRFDEAEGRRTTAELLDGDWPFTAILCANDRLALGAIEMLRERGLDCPGDVSVTGFNDIPFLDQIPPGLTTVRVQQFEVGQASAELLVRKMTEPEADLPEVTVMPVKLIERHSVGEAAPVPAR